MATPLISFLPEIAGLLVAALSYPPIKKAVEQMLQNSEKMKELKKLISTVEDLRLNIIRYKENDDEFSREEVRELVGAIVNLIESSSDIEKENKDYILTNIEKRSLKSKTLLLENIYRDIEKQDRLNAPDK